MKEIHVIIIFILGFSLGIYLCFLTIDSIALFKAKLYCKQAVEYECDCKVEGKYMTYYATHTTRSGRKVTKYFDWFDW